MGIEIERRFLVDGNEWRANVTNIVKVAQGYLSIIPQHVVRVRIIDDLFGLITIKGEQVGASRVEFEYEIPVSDAMQMLELTPVKIEKIRHMVLENGNLWEVDVFKGIHTGLIIAELELDSENLNFTKPSWLGLEVTSDHKYSNSMLSLGKN